MHLAENSVSDEGHMFACQFSNLGNSSTAFSPLPLYFQHAQVASKKKKKKLFQYFCFSYQSDSLELSNKPLKVAFWGMGASFASISYVRCYSFAEIHGYAGEKSHSTGLNLT